MPHTRAVSSLICLRLAALDSNSVKSLTHFNEPISHANGFSNVAHNLRSMEAFKVDPAMLRMGQKLPALMAVMYIK